MVSSLKNDNVIAFEGLTKMSKVFDTSVVIHITSVLVWACSPVYAFYWKYQYTLVLVFMISIWVPSLLSIKSRYACAGQFFDQSIVYIHLNLETGNDGVHGGNDEYACYH